MAVTANRPLVVKRMVILFAGIPEYVNQIL